MTTNANNGPVGNPQTPSHSASLYVGDLAPDVTEALLFEIFNAVGPVASIRVCRDAVTRRSLGYAYVNFHNVIDAERALDTMNFISIRGRPCRIMWSQRDPSLRKSGVGNVFVKNLDKSIDNKTLYDTFSMFGNILSCKVSTDAQGSSLGYGFVHYTQPEAAKKAIQKVNGMVIAEKKVTVAEFIPKEHRKVGPRKFTNVYIQRIPKSWDEEQMKKFFEPAGAINSVCVAREEDGTSKGFGFVNFPNPEHAEKCVDLFHQKEVDGGEQLYVSRAMKKMEREKHLKDRYEKIKTDRQKKFGGVNLYVKYLDDTIDDARLRQEFEKFGSITSAKVMLDAQGRSKGFGFVCFENEGDSTKAMAEMNSKLVEGKPLYVALAQRKEVRRATLAKEKQAQNKDRRLDGQGPPGRGPNMKAPMGYPGRGGYGGMPMYGNQQRPGGFQPMMFQQRGPSHLQQRGWNPNMGPQGNPMMGQFPPQGGMYPPGNQRGMPPMNQMPPVRGPNANRPGNPGPRPGAQHRAPAPQTQNRPQDLPNQPLTSEMLNSANPSQQKQMIGERIFPLIQAREPKLAGKITGMLLEMDNMELLHLLEDEKALMGKINEALMVLNQHAQQQNKPGAPAIE